MKRIVCKLYHYLFEGGDDLSWAYIYYSRCRGECIRYGRKGKMNVEEMLRFMHDRPMTGEARDLAVKQARERGFDIGDTGTVYGPFTTSEVIRLLLAGSHWPMRWFKRRRILKEIMGWEQTKSI